MCSADSDFNEYQNVQKYLWGQNRFEARQADGENFTIIDLTRVALPRLNPHNSEILLVRDEYGLAHDIITKRAEVMRAAFLVTGQPGIGGLRCPPQGHELIAHTGKTMFLIYLLARLLCNRQTVALQISARHYVLFTEQGATIHEGDKPGGIPKDVWALSDTLGMAETHPCSAFLFSQHAHLVHTSSPAARNSKDWVKQISATEHIMDLWSEKEVERLLYVMVLCSVLH